MAGKTVALQVRVDRRLLQQVDELREHLEAHPHPAMLAPCRSSVVRMLLYLGLEIMQAQVGAP